MIPSQNDRYVMKLKVAFDVDGTLIHQVGQKEDTPRYDVIAIFRSFQNLGNDMYVWSGGGIDYARRWAEKLGLDCTIAEKGSFRADIAFDDMEVDLAKVNVRV
jgi:hydroxymethylpyrimidine pyrophosphatase-like HAD family hydrolase